MKLYYDFHIHSALSPCAEEDMTINNILNMSMLKELDAVAITDHNSILNIKKALQVAKDMDIILIPGIEVQTREDVHILCLFKDYESIDSFYNELEEFRIKVKHNPEKFGRQLVLDEMDEIVSEYENSLYFSYQVSIEYLLEMTNRHDGVFIPCHLDRNSFSIVSNLGFIPFDMDIKTIEFSKQCKPEEFVEKNRTLKNYSYIINSDAHDLASISERENYIEVEERSVSVIIEALRKGWMK